MPVLEYTIPTSWNELTKKQVMYIASCWDKWMEFSEKQKLAADSKSTKVADFWQDRLLKERIKLFIILTGLNRFSAWKKRKLFWNYLDCDLIEDLEDVEFIFQKNELTANHIPTLWIGFKKCYASNGSYPFTTAGEFAFADKCFTNFHATGDVKELNKLIAILYRPKAENNNPESSDYTGDIREKFNKHNVEARAKKIRFISRTKKIAILLWYMGCRKKLTTTYKNVFPKKSEGKASKYGWLSVWREMAGKDVVKIQKIENLNISLMMTSLSENIAEAKELALKNKK